MKKRILSILCCAVSFMGSSSWAVKIPNLYQADVSVVSQSDADKNRALKTAMLQVLVKLTGNPHIDKNNKVKLALGSADSYVEEFGYHRDSAGQSSIQARFDARALKQLLQEAGQHALGEERPLIMVWLTVAEPKKPAELMGDESTAQCVKALKSESQSYGVPIVFPVMDMADISKVAVSDVRSLKMDALAAASQRYSPDYILVGNIDLGDRAVGQWRLSAGTQVWNFKAADQTIDEMVNHIFAQVTQAVTQQDVTKSAHPARQWLILNVTNIKQRDDLVQLMHYLQQIGQVKQVQLQAVSGQEVALRIQMQGELPVFEKNITIGQHLVLKSEDKTNNKLVYDWVR